MTEDHGIEPQYTELVARFAADLTYDDLPERVKQALRTLTLDALSCGIGGIATPPGGKTVSLMGSIAGRGKSTVWATGTDLPGMLAAYVNSSLSNSLDFDDTYSGAGHPGATVVPVTWAMAEEKGVSGRQLIAGIATGYEVSVRLGLALRPTVGRHKDVFGYGHQTLGAAAAGSNVMGFSTAETATALGIAAVHSPVPAARRLNLSADERPLSWMKNNYGWMAMGAILSCELTASGFPGPKNILDGSNGYWNMAGSDQFNASELSEGLGRRFVSMDTEIKPYACCRWVHSAVEAADLLGKQIDKASIEDIANVKVEWFAGRNLFDVAHPVNTLDAQFSLPFVVAAAICGSTPITPIDEASLSDPVIAACAEKVQTSTDPAFEKVFAEGRGRPARVTVVMSNGKRLSETVETPLGHPSRLLGWDAVAEKSHRLVAPILGEPAAKRLVQLCDELDTVRSLDGAWDAITEGRRP